MAGIRVLVDDSTNSGVLVVDFPDATHFYVGSTGHLLVLKNDPESSTPRCEVATFHESRWIGAFHIDSSTSQLDSGEPNA